MASLRSMSSISSRSWTLMASCILSTVDRSRSGLSLDLPCQAWPASLFFLMMTLVCIEMKILSQIWRLLKNRMKIILTDMRKHLSTRHGPLIKANWKMAIRDSMHTASASVVEYMMDPRQCTFLNRCYTSSKSIVQTRSQILIGMVEAKTLGMMGFENRKFKKWMKIEINTI